MLSCDNRGNTTLMSGTLFCLLFQILPFPVQQWVLPRGFWSFLFTLDLWGSLCFADIPHNDFFLWKNRTVNALDVELGYFLWEDQGGGIRSSKSKLSVSDCVGMAWKIEREPVQLWSIPRSFVATLQVRSKFFTLLGVHFHLCFDCLWVFN